MERVMLASGAPGSLHRISVAPVVWAEFLDADGRSPRPSGQALKSSPTSMVTCGNARHATPSPAFVAIVLR